MKKELHLLDEMVFANFWLPGGNHAHPPNLMGHEEEDKTKYLET